tara:strand:- start:176 stop:424 length:249 start_codon:yes stop_codon:yes gene_type:complete
MSREDVSKEELHLNQIISSCELILDDMDNGASITQTDFNNLVFVDGIMFRMQQNVNKQFAPSNIKGGFYPADGSEPILMDED